MTTFPIVALGGEIETGPVTGKAGRYAMIPIDLLVIDDTYQRAISMASARNIRRICKAFDWAKFLPVIVTEAGDKYCVVDGQHRTTAALTLGLKQVPCYVLACSASEAAAAFAAINGNVTPMQPIDIWFAELAAGEPSAAALQKVLAAAGVKVTRKKEGLAKGETRSINVLRRALDFYGAALLTTVLQCIVETGNGNAGMITGAVLHGIGHAIRNKPEMLTSPSRLFAIFDGLNFAEMVQQAGIEKARTGNGVQFILTRMINAALAAEVRHAA